MTTFASLFTGFGGADIGAIAAGMTEIWGVECDDDIADVARKNGLNVITADILDCDPRDFERVDILHASPPCPNFSNAKADGEETKHDIALAEKVAEFITVLLPEKFTLENVYQYRNSQSWRIIAQALMTHGYQFNYWHVNTADYGVPQTRKRMITIARRDGVKPMLPPATHAENPLNGLFGKLEKWVGWYEAIEDLIPGLPESKFAKWQLERLPDELKETLYFNNQTNYGEGLHTTNGDEPAPTIVSTQKTLSAHRAFIIEGTGTGDFGTPISNPNEPMFVVKAASHKGLPRAFIVDGKLSTSGDQKKLQINGHDTPSGTVVSSHSAFRDARAFIVDDGNSKNGTIKTQEQPMATVRTLDSGGAMSGAFIVNTREMHKSDSGANYTCRATERPVYTLSATSGPARNKAYTSGRVVQMTPRALARFQSFPDWYRLPDGKRLACKGIGNAVPPLFMQRLCESLVEETLWNTDPK